MKKLLLALLVSTLSGPAAAHWVKLGETHDTILFQAPATFIKVGEFGRVWEIQDFKEDVPFNGKDWVPIPPNSIASISFRVVCSR